MPMSPDSIPPEANPAKQLAVDALAMLSPEDVADVLRTIPGMRTITLRSGAIRHTYRLEKPTRPPIPMTRRRRKSRPLRHVKHVPTPVIHIDT